MANNLVAEFGRVSKANIAEYIKGAKDETLTSRPLLKLLEKKGKITYGHTGEYLDWGILKGVQDSTAITDGAELTISRKQPYDRAKLGWFGLQVNDAFTAKEKLMNAGSSTALIKYVQGLSDYIKKSLRVGIHKGLYLNGETTANANKMHGIETWFNAGTATIPTSGMTAIEGCFGTNTYAGIRLDAVYNSNYYWLPAVMPDKHAAGAWVNFETSDTMQILDAAQIESMERNDGKNADCILMGKVWYRALRQRVIALENIYVEKSGNGDQAADVGFKYVEFAGTPVFMESDMPTAPRQGTYAAYVLQTDEIEYCVLGEDFIRVDIEGDIEAGLFTKLVGYHFGQLKTTSPRHQVKILDQA